MKLYPKSAMRRAMKVVEVILKAIGGDIKWIQAADILGVTPRHIRRIRAAYQERGIDGLYDRRSGRSPALPYPPAKHLQVKGLHHKTQPDISCAMKTGHLYVLLTHGPIKVDSPALTVYSEPSGYPSGFNGEDGRAVAVPPL